MLDRIIFTCLGAVVGVALAAADAWFVIEVVSDRWKRVSTPDNERFAHAAMATMIGVYAIALMGPCTLRPLSCCRGVLHTLVLVSAATAALLAWIVERLVSDESQCTNKTASGELVTAAAGVHYMAVWYSILAVASAVAFLARALIEWAAVREYQRTAVVVIESADDRQRRRRGDARQKSLNTATSPVSRTVASAIVHPFRRRRRQNVPIIVAPTDTYGNFETETVATDVDSDDDLEDADATRLRTFNVHT